MRILVTLARPLKIIQIRKPWDFPAPFESKAIWGHRVRPEPHVVPAVYSEHVFGVHLDPVREHALRHYSGRRSLLYGLASFSAPQSRSPRLAVVVVVGQQRARVIGLGSRALFDPRALVDRGFRREEGETAPRRTPTRRPRLCGRVHTLALGAARRG